MTIIFDGTQGITTPTETANNSVTTPVVKSSANLVFQSNGTTEAMRIDTSQRVGIGTANTLGNSLLNVAEGIVARNSGGTSPYFQLYNGTAGTDLKTWRIGGSPQGNLIIDTVNDAYSVGTERMRIDSSGRVTMPYQPSFIATANASTDRNPSTPTTWNSVVRNIGNHYNSSTGRFTAPVAGLYSFTYNYLIESMGGGDTLEARLYVSSGPQYPAGRLAYQANNTGYGGYLAAGTTVVVYLNANDYTYTQYTRSGSTGILYTGGEWCYFMGYLIG